MGVINDGRNELAVEEMSVWNISPVNGAAQAALQEER